MAIVDRILGALSGVCNSCRWAGTVQEWLVFGKVYRPEVRLTETIFPSSQQRQNATVDVCRVWDERQTIQPYWSVKSLHLYAGAYPEVWVRGCIPSQASVSVAGRLTFPHIQNVHVQNCKQNWLPSSEGVQLSGNFAPEPPPGALFLELVGGCAQTLVIHPLPTTSGSAPVCMRCWVVTRYK